jgi:hypothetical protein
MNEGHTFNSNIWIYILKSLGILPNFVTRVSNNGEKFSFVGENSHQQLLKAMKEIMMKD